MCFMQWRGGYKPLPDYLKTVYPSGKVYVVGVKNFGESNGVIYSHRNEPSYLQQSVALDEFYTERNEIEKREYKDHYIDMIGAVQLDDGTVAVFTPDGRLISQDCRHLTHAGAQYYAEIMDLSWIC